MKNNLFLLLIFASTFLACSDEETPSTVDTKEWNLDVNRDTSYKPGDNFYMYTIGTWYKNTDLGTSDHIGFLYNDAPETSRKRMAAIDDATINKFWGDSATIDKTTAVAQAVVNENLKIAQNIKTEEDVCNAIAKAMQLGYMSPIRLALIPKAGKLYAVFLATQKIGTSGEYNIIDLASETKENYLALRNVQSRGTEYDRINNLAEKLGISADNVMIGETSVAELNNILSNTTGMGAILSSVISNDMRYTSHADFERINKSGYAYTLDSLMNIVKEQYMSYIYAHAFIKKNLPAERASKMKEVCEAFRSTFMSRIDNLAWMSSATKVQAKEKLASMIFNVGTPDKWIDAGLPTLTGTTLVEDIIQLRQARFALTNSLVGTDRTQSSFEFVMLLPSFDISMVDAFYYLPLNSINVFPSFILSPLNDDSYSDAYNYAASVTIGHEITHGFDNNGSTRDKNGDKGDWWQTSDKMEFVKRQNMLINNYNMLEIMPDELPLVYNNGTRTLGENIADLGGIEIVYQTYLNKLINEGYKGDELVKQEKKFFESFANIWRVKYNAAFAKYRLDIDVHSLPKERVNGVMMNCDSWYDLYEVKWGVNRILNPNQGLIYGKSFRNLIKGKHED